VNFQGGAHQDSRFWGDYFPEIVDPSSPTEAFKLLSSTKRILSGRLHSSIYAAAANVPQIATISYHHKFEYLGNLGLATVDWNNLDEILYSRPDATVLESLSQRTRSHLLSCISEILAYAETN
jgi:polysaccharide pyruvyl transferase WcaK-like protein